MLEGNFCAKNKQSEVTVDFNYKGEKRTKGELKNGCGCYIPVKKNGKNSQCPLGKWEEFKYIE